MRRMILAMVLSCSGYALLGQLQLRYEEGYSLNHQECISAYSELAEAYDNCRLVEAGPSDTGLPIHLFTIGDMASSKPTVLINNAIHPGEPCGVEASLMIVEKLLSEDSPILDKVNIAVIPMYNIGGALNRGCCTRANQEGPVEQGFRGNARHLDLNRDFIKADSRNAQTFQQVFQQLKPAFLVDTHTSNGADYPYTMTLIHSQSDMMDQQLGKGYCETLVPTMYARMEAHYPMVPYMDLIGDTPKEGIVDFPDWPRYSTGYAALWNCFGFTTEAHMLKPYKERVLATYHFLDELLAYTAEHAAEIQHNKLIADQRTRMLDHMYLDFALDTLAVDSFLFKGYEPVYELSKVTGLQRLRYDRNVVWEDYIVHMKQYVGVDQVSVPTYYYVPQAWHEVITQLERNGVEMERITEDVTLDLDAYYIEDHRTGDQPYEGHYLHNDVKTHTERQQILLHAGDYRVATEQDALRYIVNVLEPRAEDSFFAWGYFDSVLQQKEYFSPYVFEDMAEEILADDPELKAAFEEKRKDEAFAQDMWAQLIYIYRNSDYYEEEHMRYPIFRSID